VLGLVTNYLDCIVLAAGASRPRRASKQGGLRSHEYSRLVGEHA